MIKCEFSIGTIQTLIRVLDYVVEQTGSGPSSYAIDSLCRRDCAARCRGIRQYLNGRLPKKNRFA